MAHTLARILPNFGDYLTCISCVYTKVPEQHKSRVNKVFEKAVQEMTDGDMKEQENHDAVVTLFTHMCDTSRTMCLDPIKDDRCHVLKRMFQGSAHWIESPSQLCMLCPNVHYCVYVRVRV